MSSDSSSSAPDWRQFSTDRLAAIESKRREVESQGTLVMAAGATYGIICPACTKPNTLTVDFCTGCSFPVNQFDIQRLPDNIFLELINGKDIGAKVHYRDSNILVFDDKFPVSDNHIDIIPTEVIEDISKLNSSHIPLLENLFQYGKQELMKRNLLILKSQNNNHSTDTTTTTAADTTTTTAGDGDILFNSYVSAGYNYPVSVKHLHLHMMLPPYKHKKILQYPRWHSHGKVINDLKLYNKVLLYNDNPDEINGNFEQERANKNSEIVLKLLSNI